MSTKIEQHKKWMQRDRNADTARNDTACPCENCGCIGNNTCGHECLDNDCALDEMMVCPCCNAVFDKTRKLVKAGKGEG